MKSILYSVCVGSLALALAAAGAQAAKDKDKRPERAKPQQRTANVHAARPANTGMTMSAQRNVSAAQNRQQRSYAKPRASSAVNRKPVAATPSSQRFGGGGAAATPATARDRNPSVNRNRNVAVNRDRNVAVNRTRNFDANRERNVAVNRTRNADANHVRNANEFRGRNNAAINRNRNITVNRTQNAANYRRGNVGPRDEGVASTRTNATYYRGGNVRITNNWRGDAFRSQRYAAFRNYNRQWHDRSWWRSHYDRIIFVNNGWWYWNAGYWFPAWGYAPSVTFVFDGPIYAYNGLSPDQVTVNVQEALAAAGYYDGPIDGILGPMTREAIAAYQADNGLAITSAIDEPTLATMGLV
jgi:putative peptidoglycan binding protein